MKFTLAWLKDHLETDASLDAIVAALTDLGLEVEQVDDPAARLAAFSVAHVVAVAPHPNADKLKLCTVETGQGRAQVVCGAPNAMAGMKAVYAAEGTYIPGGDFTLKAAKIRGVESRGMLCSAAELMISDDHEGIIELPADAAVGGPAAAVLGLDDPVIDIAITPNRQDCLGVDGIARDLAARGLGRLKTPATQPVPGHFQSPIGIKLDFDAGSADACPVFAGRLIRGVQNRASPAWLQARLRAIGLRPISALVDITNYISIDRGRPLHVYDAGALAGDIGARLARPGEKLLALDGREYSLDPEMCVIADDVSVLALGGIMGGEASGATEQTRDVFLESAYFDPARTARTGRKLGIVSDARYRFERGVDPAFVVAGMELATAMIVELCGGTPSDAIIAGAEPVTRREIQFRPSRVEALTGMAVDAAAQQAILEKLGFVVTKTDEIFLVAVPSWRRDVEGEADLVEEIVRVNGLDKVPATALPRPTVVAEPILTSAQRRVRLLRRAVAGRGFHEAITWSFLAQDQARLFGGGGDDLILANPIAADMDCMRPSLLPGLLAATRRNADRGLAPVRLFEIGRRYLAARGDSDERPGLGLVMAGETGPRHWRDRPRPFDAFDAKAEALAALAAIAAPVDKLQVRPEAPSHFHPGQSGALCLGPKNILAHFGMLHPAIAAQLDISLPVAMAELYLDAVPVPKQSSRSRPPSQASDLQSVTRDFAFLVDVETPAGLVLDAAQAAARDSIAAIGLFDVYQGKGVPEGQKSLAIAVTLQPRQHSFTEDEIDAIGDAIIAAVATKTGAVLRG